jgi:hypothetical protein
MQIGLCDWLCSWGEVIIGRTSRQPRGRRPKRRLARSVGEGDDILADCSADGAEWRQMRVACRATDVRLELAGAGPAEAP